MSLDQEVPGVTASTRASAPGPRSLRDTVWRSSLCTILLSHKASLTGVGGQMVAPSLTHGAPSQK